jgi:uncharacterized membrane protein YccC
MHFQASQWIVITTLVVMCAQINVGSVIQKSYMRFLGTLTGSLLAILTLLFFGNDNLVNINIVLISAIAYSFIATSTKSYNEFGTLGAVTVTLILFGPNPTVQTGIERCLEISVGIFIAALVSQFIFPIHAKTHLQQNQANTLQKIRSRYLNLFSSSPFPDNTNPMSILDEEIVKSLIMQRKLASEARREKLGKNFSIDHFQQSLWCEKEIIRSIMFMYYAYQKSYDLEIMRENKLLLENFHRDVSHMLDTISLASEKNTNPVDTLMDHLTKLKKLLNNTTTLPQEQQISVDTFIFCAEILVERLTKLRAIKNDQA